MDRPDEDKVRKIINRRNEISVIDELTGVYTRRYIYERLPFDILKSVAKKTPLTVFMTDLDEYKKINDCYGHVVGDYVLRAFAKVLKSYVRKDRDWMARYGGDEFLVVLGATDSKDAYHILDRMRQKVQGSKMFMKIKP
ncbi:MAG: GGDEF domain-containing protein [Desulfitobacteriaceae bacterium]|nr:GGDEF domain-containing protein [Desulfitobacteriaceae bacterium]MDI6915907.1 GGDEF domain-containing protein [Desulfitobacteriaceae bacterium]